MKCVVWKLTGKAPWTMLTTGDWHLGHPSVHEDGIAHCLERTRKVAAWVHLADIAECILPNDRRFSVDEHGSVAVVGAWKTAVDYLTTGRKNCIGMVSGNHEASVGKVIGNVSRFLCGYADVPYLTQTALITLKGPKEPVRWAVAHGHLAFTARGADAERNDLNREKRLRQYATSILDADIIGLGHGHRSVIAPPVLQYKIGQYGLDALRRATPITPGWVYMCPSFMKVYGDAETYAEASMLPSSDLGWTEYLVDKNGGIPCVRVMDEDGRVIVEREPKVVA